MVEVYCGGGDECGISCDCDEEGYDDEGGCYRRGAFYEGFCQNYSMLDVGYGSVF